MSEEWRIHQLIDCLNVYVLGCSDEVLKLPLLTFYYNYNVKPIRKRKYVDNE